MRKALLTFILIPVLLFYANPVGAAGKEGRKWQDENVYFLMTDRFNNGDTTNDFKVDTQDMEAFQGGDFKGVMDKLDYIKGMGFTTIRLTPVFDNGEKGYHGYWVKNFHQPDEHFGSMKTFKKLVKEAHKRDIKVMVDFVVNNVSPEHPWLTDGEKENWFHPEDGTGKDAMVEDLPDLNQDNPEVKKYLIDAGKWWIKESGIDGYFIDSAQHVPEAFLNDFAKEMRDAKHDFYLVADAGGEKLKQAEAFDAVIDYSKVEPMRQAFAKPDGDLEAVVKGSDFSSDKSAGTARILDNQDFVRFTKEAVDENQHPGTRWKQGLTYLYTVPGVPVVYYGSEIALNGEKPPENRRLMNFKTDKDLIDYMAKIGELRNQLPSLTRGSMEVLYAKGGVTIFKRSHEKETTVVVINNTEKSQAVSIPEKEIAEGMELRGMLSDDKVKSEDGKYKIVQEREEAQVFMVAPKSGLNIPYLLAMAAVYAAFFAFIFILIKRASKKKNN
ncbi:alpha-amylase family glycosyl hydrolase [Bacillus massilinigeriensis]|uniref:alpha-amylase family glycosyl hydrolase n=1 Tax=Bacillus mediterraneensis TaxID=1805474 RepID=UPI0008F8B41F|nr:alpha-amylase family glycosyl hydrolase [Bacillus mediterraneensis]